MLSVWPPDAALSGALALCGLFIAATWLGSILTGNYSQVDRLWSITPGVYATWFAFSADFADGRLNVMAALAIAWGARLTYNFARKGGYSRGHEDYRWPVLRERMSPLLFQVFNATFIATYQNVLLLLMALPAYAAWVHQDTPLGVLDGVAGGLLVLFLVGETVADEQQWRFQNDKHARLGRGETVDANFLTRGLFRYSRHPNFFCEQAIWWCFYGFSVAAGAGWLNWTVLGAALLTLLFQGSTAFTEKLSLAKYPEYADYQRSTSRLMPWFPGS